VSGRISGDRNARTIWSLGIGSFQLQGDPALRAIALDPALPIDQVDVDEGAMDAPLVPADAHQEVMVTSPVEDKLALDLPVCVGVLCVFGHKRRHSALFRGNKGGHRTLLTRQSAIPLFSPITRRFSRYRTRLAGTGVRLRFAVARDENRPRRDYYARP
jgi:hypothetical protein